MREGKNRPTRTHPNFPHPRSCPVERGCPLFRGGTQSAESQSSSLRVRSWKVRALQALRPVLPDANSHSWASSPARWELHIHTKNCAWMFIAGLFTVRWKWKQHRCFSTSAWFNCGASSPRSTISNKKERAADPLNHLVSPQTYMHKKSKPPKVT